MAEYNYSCEPPTDSLYEEGPCEPPKDKKSQKKLIKGERDNSPPQKKESRK